MCLMHVVMKMVFMDCMKFRKSLGVDDNQLSIPKILNGAVEMTLCTKEEGKDYHNLECIERTCEDCSVHKFPLSPEESGDNGLVKWSRYEYVTMGKYLPDRKEKKKITLLQKDPPPSQLFKYFTDLLAEYPSHTFMARWQHQAVHSQLSSGQ